MFNNRMLAVAAVLVMAVPALGAATPIVVPPVPEQLVEGHTVFTVIEIVAENKTRTQEVRFAAAVAVLVREYQNIENQADQRFPGVLWFNDQYLTNPYNRLDAQDDVFFRYPCGGAVMAVNAGDPDPRMVLARVGDGGNTYGPDGDITVGDSEHTYSAADYWVKPYPGTYSYGNDYAWIGSDGGASVDPADPTNATAGTVWSDTVLTNGIDYHESYLITDPNDHSWIIDKYNMYTRTFLPTRTTSTVYSFPVWVVNMLGSPVFIPDPTPVGALNNCSPFKDLIDTVGAPINSATCGVALPVSPGDGEGNDHNTDIPNVNGFPYTDDPCMGYQEPSRNGYCYGGQSAALTGGSCPHGEPGKPGEGDPPADAPLRQYNALLYFHLEDLYVADAPRDHSDPVGSLDTNGCSEEQYPWGPNPPQAASDWPCPGGDDDAEGNSHPFHPIAPPHEEAEPCPAAFAGSNPSNHGGSTYIDPAAPPTMRADGGHDWYQVYAPCDYLHATRNIDIYFSGAGRPFAPVLRNFVVLDLEGSSAPFQDFHASYPGTP